MTTKKLTRACLYNPNTVKEIAKLETASGRPNVGVRGFSLDELVKHTGYKIESTGVVPELVEQKIIDLAIQGAEFVDILPQVATIVPMDSEIEMADVYGYTDFGKVKPLKSVRGTKPINAAGVFDRIKLDCSNEKGLLRVDVNTRKRPKKNSSLGIVEKAIRATSQTIMDTIMNEVFVDLLADVDSDMSNTVANWGNDHYKSLIKGFSLLAAARMPANFAVINPAELYDLYILDKFVSSDYAAKAATQAYNYGTGYAGSLLPNSQVPIYFSANMTAASMLLGNSERSAVVGFYQPLTISNYENILEGTEGGVIEVQYDIKNGSNALKTKPTALSWATVTGA